jgi:uncharacterized protein YjbI with pentapeptide repeats
MPVGASVACTRILGCAGGDDDASAKALRGDDDTEVEETPMRADDAPSIAASTSTLLLSPPEERERWCTHWRLQGQPWRSEPEISEERQTELAERRAVAAAIAQGSFPFAGDELALTRADVEWLLATHEDGRGPVEWGDPAQRTRVGLDLRGARLSGADLRGLPLAGLVGGLPEHEWRNASPRQIEAAALHLERADLSEAHLEGALLEGAHLERARLRGAFLDGAILSFARMEGAYLREARLESAALLGAGLEGAILHNARLAGANLSNARLAGAELYSAHLEGARLGEAALGGTTLAHDDLERLRRWLPDFAETLPGADLRGVFFDNATALDGADLGDEAAGCASMSDVRWGGVNLAVVDWAAVKLIGDEREAWIPIERAGRPKDAEARLAEFREAVRANRQLVVALRDQGLNEEADRFAYRAQHLQREVLLRQALRGDGASRVSFVRRAQRFGAYLFSGFLDLLAGYGYKPGRSLVAYLLFIVAFAGLYLRLGGSVHPALSPLAALIFSITSFHGRGFFPGGVALDNPLTVVAAAEAIVGLIIEISFIATFTQRFFGK